MLRNAYLYENIMFTNKVNQSIAFCGKGKDRVLLIKIIIKWEFEEALGTLFKEGVL